MDRRRDGAARRHRTSLDVESRHWKMIHAPTRVHTRTYEPARGRQAAGEKRSVMARVRLFSSGVATGV